MENLQKNGQIKLLSSLAFNNMEIISKRKDNLGFEHSLFQGLNWKQPRTEKNFKNWKDEIITEFTNNINAQRKASGWKYIDKKGKEVKTEPVTEGLISVLINQHPIYKEDKDECYKLLKTCREKHFGIFFWALKIK